MEEWKDIKGYEGLYQVSNLGRVKSLSRLVGTCYRKDKTKSQFINNSGYKVVTLNNQKRERKFLVHRLVAEAFVLNPENKYCVNHIDGNKLNNNVENLEWTTRSENMKHAYNIGLNKHKRKIAQYDKNMKLIKTWESIKDVCDFYKIESSNIVRCCKGEQLTSCGYIWRYLDE